MQRLFFAAAIAGLALAVSSVRAADPTMTPDQQMADQIKASLCGGQLHHFSIDVQVKDKTCWVTGTVRNQQQRQTALNIAADTQGIDQVVDGLKTTDTSAQIVQASAAPEGDVSAQLAVGSAGGDVSAGVTAPAPRVAGTPRPIAIARAQALPGCAPGGPGGMAGGGPIPAYAPGVGGGVAPAHFDRPNMPGYAWPSYASYPNYAGITYPRQYSPTAWPYIGPFYPYPQVPLGWRKVTLEWHDGWWNLDFKDGDGGCH
jgi:hypothetical protein